MLEITHWNSGRQDGRTRCGLPLSSVQSSPKASEADCFRCADGVRVEIDKGPRLPLSGHQLLEHLYGSAVVEVPGGPYVHVFEEV